MKGLELPVNMIVIILIAVIVLLAITAFFLMQSGSGMNTIEATRIWTVGCNAYCQGSALDAAYNACGSDLIGGGTDFSRDFTNACKTLGYITASNQCVSCLRQCPNNCNIDQIEASRRDSALQEIVNNLGGIR